MATSAQVLERIRLSLRDEPRLFQCDTPGDGQATLFTLPHVCINPNGLLVTVQGSTPRALVADTDYRLYDAAGQVLILGAPPTVNETVIVEGEHWTWFTDTQLEPHIATAIYDIENDGSIDSFDDVAVPSHYFDYAVASAVVDALWTLWAELALDIDLRNPEGIDLPARQRFETVERLLASWQERSKTLADLLNIGITSIEVFSLRRVSKMTNRLVPLYRAREIDNTDPPERILPPIDDGVVNG